MTPEDAVSGLKEFLKEIERFPNDDTFRYELDRNGAEAILEAIRTAENAALERAAVECDRLASPDTDYAAEAVRALKHIDPQQIARIATTDGKNEFERLFSAEMGGSIRTHASEIDFAASYTFQSWESGRLYEWVGIRATREGDDAVFVLPSTIAK